MDKFNSNLNTTFGHFLDAVHSPQQTGRSGIFHCHNPSDRTIALGSTQPLTEMSTRNISWGVKSAGE
jgi:hypothetical protein